MRINKTTKLAAKRLDWNKHERMSDWYADVRKAGRGQNM